MNFKQIRIELDATLIAYRARDLHNKGLAPHSIAKKLSISSDRVKKYISGVYCTAKSPSLPKRVCPQRSKVWGIPVLRFSCSSDRLRLNSEFHRKSYIPRRKNI